MWRFLSIIGLAISIIMLVVTLINSSLTDSYETFDEQAYTDYINFLSSEAQTAQSNGNVLGAAFDYAVLLNLEPEYISDDLNNLNEAIQLAIDTCRTELQDLDQVNDNAGENTEQSASFICTTLINYFLNAGIAQPIVIAPLGDLGFRERLVQTVELEEARPVELSILGYLLSIVSFSLLVIIAFRKSKTPGPINEERIRTEIARTFVGNDHTQDFLGEAARVVHIAKVNQENLSTSFMIRLYNDLATRTQWALQLEPIAKVGQSVTFDPKKHDTKEPLRGYEKALVRRPGWKRGHYILIKPEVTTNPDDFNLNPTQAADEG